MNRHFNGLAALRAIAALIVVVGHVELLKYRSAIPAILGNPSAFWPDGHLAVVLFFVLSGFLISHILVEEKEATGRIALCNFYMRRILRIWPLYYLVIVLSLVFVKAERDAKSILLTLAVFPNLARALGTEWPASPQIWSVGVEEQFYLLLPLLVRRIPARRLLLVLGLFFVGYTFLPHVVGYINVRTIQSEWINVVYMFFEQTRFNCISIGCLLGIQIAMRQRGEVDSRNGFLKHLYSKPIAYAAIFLSFGLWFGKVQFWYFTAEVYSVLFGIMILNLATNADLKLNLEREPFKFLGKISYGIYMYHWLIILLILRVMPYEAFQGDLLYNFSLYTAVLAATILVSWLSFVSLERYFLNMKKAFSPV
jgi:peptidoglycan/LPS O-acetylase OafA/YrhL